MSHLDIGVLEPCERWEVESRLFPSKVGGKPAWLNFDSLPDAEKLQCQTCKQPMSFILQVYAPYEEDDDNFHRTVFVFVCRNPPCFVRNNTDNFKVFRSSLKRDNKFYPYDPPIEAPDLTFNPSNFVQLCSACGCLATKFCSKCKVVPYCSREHQLFDWKESHKSTCGTAENQPSSLLFTQWEIVTENEICQDELDGFEKMHIDEPVGTMADVSESDLDAYVNFNKDKAFLSFQKRVANNPQQILRYYKGGTPLWIAKEPIPARIPNCEYCGCERWFEFQIMPQLLSVLKDHAMDWGVLAIYTCKNSCTGGDDYKLEFMFKQDVSLSNE